MSTLLKGGRELLALGKGRRMLHNKCHLSVAIALITLFTWSPASADDPPSDGTTKNDNTTISEFTSLLDRTRHELDGCRGEWQGRSGGTTMGQIMCRHYDGPGEFKGAGTTVVLIGQRISMIATQVGSHQVQAARQKFERLRSQVGGEESGCTLSEESDKQAKYQCDGHRITISFSRAAGKWNTSLTVARN